MLKGVFVQIFSNLSDPRVDRTKKHLFLDVIGLSLFAVLAGSQSYTEIEDFCCHHHEWLKKYFQLPFGVPSHDTFSRVFSAINPEDFQECFFLWVKEVISIVPENVIALDGKSIKASKRTQQNLKALHIVSAWSCANGMSLGQVKVDDKSNEIKAIPLILEKICIDGAIITIDAMGCQKEIAKKVVDLKGDYILRVKGNQKNLDDALDATFKSAEENNFNNMVYYTAEDEVNNDHGRIESRKCIVLPLMYLMMLKLKWKGLKSLVLVISERETPKVKSVEYRYYISSLDPSDPKTILQSIRKHWQIENNLHWALDVSFREDQCQTRNENSVLNMAWLRKTALALLKRAQNIKGSIRRKQLALWAKPQQLIDIVQI